MLERYTGTILKGTNRLITSSGVEFGALREDSFIILDGQTNFYKIIGKEKNLYIKTATVKDEDKLIVDGEDKYKFCLNDLVTFTHKQYFVASASVDPERRGSGYKVGDVFNLKHTEGIVTESGTFAKNSYDGSEEAPLINVSEVDGDGGILSLKISSGGRYNKKPDLEMGFDSGLSLNLEFEIFENRVMEDRVIRDISHEGHITILSLDHPLPENFISGKVSVNKWELLLHINYASEDSLNVNYRVCKDFTPNYNLPLMHVGAITNESAYNESLSILDGKIKELENKINES